MEHMPHYKATVLLRHDKLVYLINLAKDVV
jgi:hypothetical protein